MHGLHCGPNGRVLVYAKQSWIVREHTDTTKTKITLSVTCEATENPLSQHNAVSLHVARLLCGPLPAAAPPKGTTNPLVWSDESLCRGLRKTVSI